ncbi:hypothetical protein LR48_Vigan08g079200 [Vigna angularis]|uniref:Spindle pole body-associated protein Vik1/Cik1 microtubule binding domain-containing protein n=1 Tax=Phaseolus angularis TaxID=3914 RepID=A0A0L9V4K2_PHAAN|nr:hypothetical protein LR48_Vigan08g079200 [Vigna angularis]
MDVIFRHEFRGNLRERTLERRNSLECRSAAVDESIARSADRLCSLGEHLRSFDCNGQSERFHRSQSFNRSFGNSLVVVRVMEELGEQSKASHTRKKVSDISANETRTKFEGQQKLVHELQRRLEDAEYKVTVGEKLRKELHNTILELKGNICVFCRVRPLLPDEACSTEGKVISYPTSMEASGRGIELTQSGGTATG